MSVSAVYRQLRETDLGDDDLQRADSYIRSELGVFSGRAVASKAVLLLNLTGGVGYDYIFGDVAFGYAGVGGPAHVVDEDASMERVTVFGELSYTLMVLNFVVAGGWQSGPDPIEDGVGGDDYDGGGTPYASVAMRLAI